jgi:nitrogen regulatory protein PII
MKTLIVIIRNECAGPLRSALEKLGVRGVAVLDVLCQKQQGKSRDLFRFHSWHVLDCIRSGRVKLPSYGAQAGRPTDAGTTEPPSSFSSRSMLIMAIADDNVFPAIRAIGGMSRSGCRDDGRIFICPMVTAVGIGSRRSG